MSEKEFHLDPDALCKEFGIPGILAGPFKKVVRAIDNMDLNHDHKRDVAQLVALAMKLAPVGSKINEFVDFNKVADVICEMPIWKDGADMVIVKAAIKEAFAAIERADDN